MKIHITTPSITMKFLDDDEAERTRAPYHGGLQWQLIELDDGSVMASSSCWHADHFDQALLAQMAVILHDDYRVRRVRTLRPKRKFVPGWRHIESGAYAGFSELILPDDLPEVFDDAERSECRIRSFD